MFAIGGIARVKDPSSTNNEVTVYDSGTNRWDYVVDTPEPLHHHAGERGAPRCCHGYEGQWSENCSAENHTDVGTPDHHLLIRHP